MRVQTIVFYISLYFRLNWVLSTNNDLKPHFF